MSADVGNTARWIERFRLIHRQTHAIFMWASSSSELEYSERPIGRRPGFFTDAIVSFLFDDSCWCDRDIERMLVCSQDRVSLHQFGFRIGYELSNASRMRGVGVVPRDVMIKETTAFSVAVRTAVKLIQYIQPAEFVRCCRHGLEDHVRFQLAPRFDLLYAKLDEAKGAAITSFDDNEIFDAIEDFICSHVLWDARAADELMLKMDAESLRVENAILLGTCHVPPYRDRNPHFWTCDGLEPIGESPVPNDTEHADVANDEQGGYGYGLPDGTGYGYGGPGDLPHPVTEKLPSAKQSEPPQKAPYLGLVLSGKSLTRASLPANVCDLNENQARLVEAMLAAGEQGISTAKAKALYDGQHGGALRTAKSSLNGILKTLDITFPTAEWRLVDANETSVRSDVSC